jgi:hypothetical protein
MHLPRPEVIDQPKESQYSNRKREVSNMKWNEAPLATAVGFPRSPRAASAADQRRPPHDYGIAQ